MRVIAAIGLVLILSMSGLAQTTATTVYQEGAAILPATCWSRIRGGVRAELRLPVCDTVFLRPKHD